MNKRFIILTFLFLVLSPHTIFSQPTIEVASQPVFISPDSLRLIQPKYSPDGKWIAAAGHQYHGIVLLNNNGKFVRWLTKVEGSGYEFTWADDSKKLVTRVFKTENRKRKSAIVIFFIENSNSQFVTDWDRDFGLPGWCNQDMSVYFLHHNELQIKEVFETQKNDDEWLRHLFPGPSLQPFDFIFYTSDDRLVIKDLKETYISNLIYPEQPILNPSIDQTNHWIAFEVLGQGLQLTHRDGKPHINLGNYLAPSWSPKSKWIVCHSAIDDGLRITSSELFAISSDGKQKIQLTNSDNIQEQQANWSPDGQFIIGSDNLTQRIFRLQVNMN